jgi:hypothetical protein
VDFEVLELRELSLAINTPEGKNSLEDRIMISAEKRRWLARAGVIALSLTTSITLGASANFARAMSPQASSEPSKTAEQFAGTWHWMFDGRSFSTMIWFGGIRLYGNRLPVPNRTQR